MREEQVDYDLGRTVFLPLPVVILVAQWLGGRALELGYGFDLDL